MSDSKYNGRCLTRDYALKVIRDVVYTKNGKQYLNAEKVGIKAWGCVDYLVKEHNFKFLVER